MPKGAGIVFAMTGVRLGSAQANPHSSLMMRSTGDVGRARSWSRRLATAQALQVHPTRCVRRHDTAPDGPIRSCPAVLYAQECANLLYIRYAPKLFPPTARPPARPPPDNRWLCNRLP
jgi:hypothetical protein